MFKRILGIVILLVGLFGLLVSIGGTIISRSVIDQLGASLETTLTLASDSLDAVDDTLHLTKTSVEQAGASLDTLAETASNVSMTMNDTQPLLDKVTETATQQVPDSIKSIQSALPDVAEAAGAIDDTIRVFGGLEGAAGPFRRGTATARSVRARDGGGYLPHALHPGCLHGHRRHPQRLLWSWQGEQRRSDFRLRR